jgi:hypothetical protein
MCIVMHPGEKPKITEFTTASYNVPTKLQVGPKLIKLVGGGGGGEIGGCGGGAGEFF